MNSSTEIGEWKPKWDKELRWSQDWRWERVGDCIHVLVGHVFMMFGPGDFTTP